MEVLPRWDMDPHRRVKPLAYMTNRPATVTGRGRLRSCRSRRSNSRGTPRRDPAGRGRPGPGRPGPRLAGWAIYVRPSDTMVPTGCSGSRRCPCSRHDLAGPVRGRQARSDDDDGVIRRAARAHRARTRQPTTNRSRLHPIIRSPSKATNSSDIDGLSVLARAWSGRPFPSNLLGYGLPHTVHVDERSAARPRSTSCSIRRTRSSRRGTRTSLSAGRPATCRPGMQACGSSYESDGPGLA